LIASKKVQIASSEHHLDLPSFQHEDHPHHQNRQNGDQKDDSIGAKISTHRLQEQLLRSLVALKFEKHRTVLLCGALAESEAHGRIERRSNEFEQMVLRFNRWMID
jgi:hypothetical protein